MKKGVRTFPSPDAFDPYGVLEGLMAAQESFAFPAEWIRHDQDQINLSAINVDLDGSVVIAGKGDAGLFLSRYSSTGEVVWSRYYDSS